MFRSQAAMAVALLGLLVSAGALSAATPPTLVNYQGRLLTSGGSPVADNTYSVVFTIWNDPTASAMANQVWTSGSVSVTTKDGLFSVTLGESPMPPLDHGVFVTEDSLYIGITVPPDGEMSPRSRFVSTPYSSLARYAINAVMSDSAYAAQTAGHAGSADSAEYLTTPGANNGDVLTWNGTGWQPNSPSTSATTGIASNHSDVFRDLVCDSMIDIATVTITTPADGYILVQGRTDVLIRGTTEQCTVILQIDETPGGMETPTSGYIDVGLSAHANPVYYDKLPAYVDKVYQKTAGTYTFRLEGRGCSFDTLAVMKAGYQGITALYVPTAMGTVSK